MLSFCYHKLYFVLYYLAATNNKSQMLLLMQWILGADHLTFEGAGLFTAGREFFCWDRYVQDFFPIPSPFAIFFPSLSQHFFQ
jgi:hypothetical protein